MDTIEREVRGFIRDNFIVDVEGLDGESSLTLSGVIDSMGVLELVTFIEERYEVEISDQDTVPENLDTIDRIVRFVQGRLGADDA